MSEYEPSRRVRTAVGSMSPANVGEWCRTTTSGKRCPSHEFRSFQ